jgi:hypothetical protein
MNQLSATALFLVLTIIEQQAGVRIGAGGPRFTLSSLNGDIHIQKIN